MHPVGYSSRIKKAIKINALFYQVFGGNVILKLIKALFCLQITILVFDFVTSANAPLISATHFSTAAS